MTYAMESLPALAFALAKPDPAQGLADYLRTQSMPGPSCPSAAGRAQARQAGTRPPKRRHSQGARRPSHPAGPVPATRDKLPPKDSMRPLD